MPRRDRKSTRLNSSHTVISYAVFCLKKKNNRPRQHPGEHRREGCHRNDRHRGEDLQRKPRLEPARQRRNQEQHDRFFFLNDTATTDIYTLSLHDALPICLPERRVTRALEARAPARDRTTCCRRQTDRKSTRLHSSHKVISYAVFCLK